MGFESQFRLYGTLWNQPDCTKPVSPTLVLRTDALEDSLGETQKQQLFSESEYDRLTAKFSLALMKYSLYINQTCNISRRHEEITCPKCNICNVRNQRPHTQHHPLPSILFPVVSG